MPNKHKSNVFKAKKWVKPIYRQTMSLKSINLAEKALKIELGKDKSFVDYIGQREKMKIQQQIDLVKANTKIDSTTREIQIKLLEKEYNIRDSMIGTHASFKSSYLELATRLFELY